jgi:hypothetical protein
MRRLTIATHYAVPLALIAAVAVMLGLGTWPHGYYYRAIRFVVCAIAILLGAAAYEQQKLAWVIALGFVGALFNPLITVPLPRAQWHVIDIVVAVLFVLAGWRVPSARTAR